RQPGRNRPEHRDSLCVKLQHCAHRTGHDQHQQRRRQTWQPPHTRKQQRKAPEPHRQRPTMDKRNLSENFKQSRYDAGAFDRKAQQLSDLSEKDADGDSIDADTLYSLGGVFDAPIFIFYRNAEPITQFAQFQGKRLSIGTPGTALRSLILQVLTATDAVDASTELLDLDSAEAIDALIAGEIDVAMFASQLDTSFLQRALGVPGLRLMNVVQAEAIAKTVPGLKHLVLSRGIISLTRDIPNSDVDLLASRNNLLVRKDLHPALQYLLLEAMRDVHWGPGPFNRLGEFPAEQPNDLP